MTKDTELQMVRRRFLQAGAAAGSIFLPSSQVMLRADEATDESPALLDFHPRMFVVGKKVNDLRSVAEVRDAVNQGHPAVLWKQLLEKVHREEKQDAWTPKTPLPSRSAAQVRRANREFTLVGLTANRIRDASLAALVKNDRRYANAALRQIDALMDRDLWPNWGDKAHLAKGMTVSLRHGQLSSAVATAYDWLHPLLTESERQRVVEGLDRCAIQPFKAAVQAEEKWTRATNNWLTVITGGYAIAGMALLGDHADAAWLIEFGRPKMENYINNLSTEGEFNESVPYAGSMHHLVAYLMAQHYVTGGRGKPLSEYCFDKFARWYMYFTFPPGRVAGFGDPAPDMPPLVDYLCAPAAAGRDPILQWFYHQYVETTAETHRWRAMELLYYDPTLQALPPAGRMPLGAAYRNQGKLISSRSSWDPVSTTSVVYGKAGQEQSHAHADWGQVCIDGYAERLIVDLGSPPGSYPGSDRTRYYNYQQWGHNVFVFGHNDTGGVELSLRNPRHGKILRAEFDDSRGGAWTLDLSDVYQKSKQVRRTVIYLLPRIVVVLDEAALDESQPISMRWHTISPAEPDDGGNFVVRGEKAALAARAVRLDGKVEIRSGVHKYKPPFDKDRFGQPYSQPHEPFVECRAEDDRCRLASLFCVLPPREALPAWTDEKPGWSIETPEGAATVTITDGVVSVSNPSGRWPWEVPANS